MYSNSIDTNSTTIAIEEPTAFLSRIVVARVDRGELLFDAEDWLGEALRSTASTGLPTVLQRENVACMLVPTIVEDEVTSIVALLARTEAASGVFEVWEPKGEYSDLQLTSGYFAKLERFQNVSSFVRFEFGTGLPGQSAKLGQAILQDGLRTHPGFLRAAGASAGELQTALGIPVFKNVFMATAVLISSSNTPLAKRIEVWLPESTNSFRLAGATTAAESQPIGLKVEGDVHITQEVELLRAVIESRSAVCTDSHKALLAIVGQENPLGVRVVLAIPTYQASELKSISLLLI